MTNLQAPPLKWVFPAMLVCLAVFALGWRSMMVAPDAGADTAFTAKAGVATLTELYTEQVPHPIGSEANRRVRDRIMAILRGAGYQPMLDTRFRCNGRYGCAQVENVVAIRRGTDPARAVMVSAHYDSVPAGPGVGDDGSGVAIVLELARELARRQPARNDVIFMFNDGEELGTFGAESFAVGNPEFKRVGAMVNLDARGTAGPSVMFETGSGNANLMKLYAEAVQRPVANSLAFEIYQRLPNRTDFTVYRDRGVIGFNLAFIGHAALYHTPSDDLQHLDPATLQHHGDHAFALVSALAATDLDAIRADGDASYFDVFGRYLVRWSASWNLPLSAAALILVLLLIALQRRQFTLGKVGWAVLAVIAPVPLLALVGWLLAFPLGLWPGALQLDHPMPWPGRIALLLTAVLVAMLVGFLVARRGAAAVTSWVVWVTMALGAVLLALFVPGAAYAQLWPAAAFAAVALLVGWWPLGAFVAAAVGFILAAFFWTGHMIMFESALGFPQSMIKAVLLTPLVWAAIPLTARAMARERSGAALPLVICLGGVVAAAAAAALVPAVSRDTPRGLDLIYYDDGAQPPRWGILLNDKRDASAFLSTAGFPDQPERYYLIGEQAFSGRRKPATPLDLGVPTFAPTSSAEASPQGARVVIGTLRLSDDAVAGGLALGANAGVRGVRIDGQTVWTEAELDGSPRFIRLAGVAGRDLKLELVLAPDAAGPVIVYQRMALPESAEVRALQTTRPVDATPFWIGDCAIVMRRIKL